MTIDNIKQLRSKTTETSFYKVLESIITDSKLIVNMYNDLNETEKYRFKKIIKIKNYLCKLNQMDDRLEYDFEEELHLTTLFDKVNRLHKDN